MGLGKELDILRLDQLGRNNTDLVGSKAASLGELTQAGFPVPAGFVITTNAYQRFLQESGLRSKIASSLRDLSQHNTKQIHATAHELQELIIKADLPTGLLKVINAAYKHLYQNQKGATVVTVRPSFVEDDTHARVADEQATFVDVVGVDGLARAMLHIWATVFSAEAIDYRHHLGIDHLETQPAVLVQVTIPARVSGVLLTANPLRDQPGDEVIIEAVLGAVDPLLAGAIRPDRYVVSRADKIILESDLHAQAWQAGRPLAGGPGSVRHRSIAKVQQRQPKLTTPQILALAELGEKIDTHFHLPQHIEWSLAANGGWWVLDSWPMQVGLGSTEVVSPLPESLLDRGVGGTMGQAVGVVHLIHKPSDLTAAKPGEVLVAETITPGQITQLGHVAGIVLATGGLTSHSLIAAREIGLACVVGASNILGRVKNGLVITLDGHTGAVYKGKMVVDHHAGHRYQLPSVQPITATKILVNVADARDADQIAAEAVDGVGLIRGEFLLAGLGKHPRFLLEDKKDQLLTRHLTEQLRLIAEAFVGRPVLYRAMDLRTDIARTLEGGDKVEPKEANPMLGYRGAARLLRELDLFQIELAVIKTLRDNHGLTNLHLMLPFVRTVEEFVQLRSIVEATGLYHTPDFQLWMTAEVPSNVILIEDFLAAGVDGISLGSNDLTQLMLGVDRDNPKMAASFQERNPAVVAALTHVVRACLRQGVPVSLSGEAGSTQPELIEHLVEAGLTSVSVDSGAVSDTRRLVASIERRIVLDDLTRAAHGHPHPIWR